MGWDRSLKVCRLCVGATARSWAETVRPCQSGALPLIEWLLQAEDLVKAISEGSVIGSLAMARAPILGVSLAAVEGIPSKFMGRWRSVDGGLKWLMSIPVFYFSSASTRITI